VLARQTADGALAPFESAAESGTGSGPSSQGGGADSDAVYEEVMRRLRQEQEQLGQLIPHPF
jgi:hypothetical protein